MKEISNIKFGPDSAKMLRDCGSRDVAVAEKAQLAVASIMRELVNKILPQKLTAGLLFREWSYNQREGLNFPLDLFSNYGEGDIRVWSQTTAGGLPTNQILGSGSHSFNTYTLDSAFSVKRRVLASAPESTVLRGIQRMTDEISAKQELFSWAIILQALATAKDYDDSSKLINATQAGIFQIDDFNNLITKVADSLSSWNGATADASQMGVTDMFMSNAILGQIRSWAYQPMNTRGVPNNDESTAVALPDQARMQILQSFSGVPSLFGVNLHALKEFNRNARYPRMFDAFYGATTPTFDPTTQDLVFAIDNTVESFVRAVGIDEDEGLDIDRSGEAVVRIDNQFTNREETVGWYTKLEEARFGIDKRNLFGLIV